MNKSIISKFGLKNVLNSLTAEISRLYQQDSIPWIIGYSGGKDSTAVLQIIWMALSSLPPGKRRKKVHVISTDTLVENPIVALWVSGSLALINTSAKKQKIPVQAHQLTPQVNDSFWVNLIGRGYPSPRYKFRWCTLRLKIMPSTRFIRGITQNHGQSLLVLGTRKAESYERTKSMVKYEKWRVQERISPNGDLENSFIYTPIEDFSDDDVWMFLMQKKNLWGIDHTELLGMYRGATADGECPLMLDTSTPSCGSSRFGCWVCTMVSEDRSMSAMIQNDEEKAWMEPLLLFRNELANKNDRGLRDFRRMHGQVQLFSTSKEEIKLIPGPYTRKTREHFLRSLLTMQENIKRDIRIPLKLKKKDLIMIEELKAIRRLWVWEKHEIEDTLPVIYKEVTGLPFPDNEELKGYLPFNDEIYTLLWQSCDYNEIHYNLVRDLLAIETKYKLNVRRSNIFTEIEKALQRGCYSSENDAFRFAVKQYREKKSIEDMEDNEDIDSLLALSDELLAKLKGKK